MVEPEKTFTAEEVQEMLNAQAAQLTPQPILPVAVTFIAVYPDGTQHVKSSYDPAGVVVHVSSGAAKKPSQEAEAPLPETIEETNKDGS